MSERRLPFLHRVLLTSAFLFAPAIATVAGVARAAGLDERAPERNVCAAPAELGRFAVGLPKTRVLLAAGKPLKIVALGSSSTAGAGASARQFNYPSRLAVELAQRNARGTIEIVNRGQNGEDARENLARLDHDVIVAHPDLVVWQTGTNAILRDVDVDDFDRAVQTGIDRMREAGIEIVLMDAQYAPRVNAVPEHRRMLAQLDAIGARNGVPVFHRYAVMRYWANALAKDDARMISADGLHMNDAGYGCVAERIADAIAGASVDPAVGTVADATSANAGAGSTATAAPAMRKGVLDRKQ